MASRCKMLTPPTCAAVRLTLEQVVRNRYYDMCWEHYDTLGRAEAEAEAGAEAEAEAEAGTD